MARLFNSLGSVGKMLMSLESRECTARRTLVLPQVMQAAMPRCRGLKWVRMAGDCSTVSRKLRISSPVQMFEKLAWAGCSYTRQEKQAHNLRFKEAFSFQACYLFQKTKLRHGSLKQAPVS